MKLDGQVKGVTAALKPEAVNRQSKPGRNSQKPEISLEDLKDQPVKKKPDIKPREDQKADRETLTKLVQTSNKFINMSSYHLQFRIDDESERLQVKLIDNETNEVVREIPPDEMLNVSARIKEIMETFQKMLGVFLDEIV